jgi:hypothetical protein
LYSISGEEGLSNCKIDAYAFYSCDLTSISIPNGVVSIGYGAFLHNSSGTITIPASVQTMRHCVFYEGESSREEFDITFLRTGNTEYDKLVITAETFKGIIETGKNVVVHMYATYYNQIVNDTDDSVWCSVLYYIGRPGYNVTYEPILLE